MSTATKTTLPKPRRNQHRATGMAPATRDLHRVKTAATAAKKLAPTGAETVARIVAAGGDPNIPRNPGAVARAGAKNAARVLGREFGGRWIVEPAG